MAESELAETDGWNAEEQVFDLWTDPIASAKNAAESQVHVLSAPKSALTALAYDLLPFGMLCDSIDGLPFAMARAVSLSLGERETPVAALDFGASVTMFVLCQQGQPVFIRRLRDSGYFRIVEQIQKRLGLDAPECARLLESIGCESSNRCPQNKAALAVASAVQAALRVLADEMGRTLRFLKADANIEPERMILMGGGSSIRHVSARITELTGLATENWTFPGQAEHGPQEGVFAAAYAAAVGGTS
jgi:Tfp pilus assembly PilM family ATPase